MKIGAIPENIIERLVLMSGLAPTPMVDTHLAFVLARTVMTAVKAQLFECLSKKELTAREIAASCKTDSKATVKLLNTLVHLGYVKHNKGLYSLTAFSRKWMLKNSDTSLYHKMLFHFVEWDLAQHFDIYLKTGESLDIHQSFTTEQWMLYQDAMRDLGRIASKEVARVVRVPSHGRTLLDIGGAHGYYAAELCKKNNLLNAVVLDLPQALSTLPQETGNADSSRVTFVEGDVRTYALGENAWDVIFMANLVHHFDEETNRMLADKIGRALRKGGVYIVLDFLREEKPKKGDHLGALMDLYFSVTSCGGTFSLKKIRTWQKEAGLKLQKIIWLKTIPHYGMQVAQK